MRSTCAAFLLLASLCSFAKPILSGSDTDSLALVSVPLTQAHTLDGGDPPVVHQQHINRGIQRLLAAQGFPLLLNKELLAMLTNRIGLNALSPNKTDSNSHSEHLEIQAEDVGYYCPMQIGTPSRTFQLLIDTGSADLWVGAEDCQCDDGGGCGPHTFLGPRSSSSFTASNETWVIWYGTGAVSGLLVTDRVSLGGLTVDHHKFGIAQNESRDFTQDGIPFDGIFGLAQSKASRQVTPTFLQVLKDEGHIDHAIASFKIPRRSDGKDDGELTLGGMNSASYDSTHAVTVKNINERGFWQMAIDDVKVNGKSMGWVDRSAVVDTGSTLFLAPQKDVASIHRAISSSRFEEGAWLVPCNTTVSVALTIGGKDFPMNPKDIAWIPADDEGECLSGISQGGVSREGPKVWLLGDVFLKNVYFSTSQETNEMTIARLL